MSKSNAAGVNNATHPIPQQHNSNRPNLAVFNLTSLDELQKLGKILNPPRAHQVAAPVATTTAAPMLPPIPTPIPLAPSQLVSSPSSNKNGDGIKKLLWGCIIGFMIAFICYFAFKGVMQAASNNNQSTVAQVVTQSASTPNPLAVRDWRDPNGRGYWTSENGRTAHFSTPGNKVTNPNYPGWEEFRTHQGETRWFKMNADGRVSGIRPRW